MVVLKGIYSQEILKQRITHILCEGSGRGVGMPCGRLTVFILN